MKTFAILLTILFIIAIAACRTSESADNGTTETVSATSAKTITEKISLENFTSLECSIHIEIFYTPNKKAGIELEIPESMAGRIEYVVRNKCLYIRLKENERTRVFKYDKILCRITAPQLNDIRLHGVTRFTASTPIESDNFKLNCNGASEIRISEIICKTFDAELNGASKAEVNISKADYTKIQNRGAAQLNITSQSNETEIYNSGAGKITGDLTGDQISLQNNGVGKFTVNVHCKKLSGKNSGVGKCDISGFADEVNLDNSGASHFDVSRLNQ